MSGHERTLSLRQEAARGDLAAKAHKYLPEEIRRQVHPVPMLCRACRRPLANRQRALNRDLSRGKSLDEAMCAALPHRTRAETLCCRMTLMAHTPPHLADAAARPASIGALQLEAFGPRCPATGRSWAEGYEPPAPARVSPDDGGLGGVGLDGGGPRSGVEVLGAEPPLAVEDEDGGGGGGLDHDGVGGGVLDVPVVAAGVVGGDELVAPTAELFA